MVSKPDIDILGEVDGCDIWGYTAKGHYEPAVFLETLRQQWDRDADPGNVKQGWWRYVPGKDADAISCMRMLSAKGPGPGVFAATTVLREHTWEAAGGATDGSG